MNEAHATQQNQNLAMTIAHDVPQDVKDAIESGIDRFSNEYTDRTRQACFITVYDGERLVGGLRAESLGEWFYIKHLWVDEDFRGQGLGMDLLNKAEQEAKARQCTILWVDTLSYQAPGLYKKAGYKAAATVPQYRGQYDRIFFRKDV